MSTTYSVTPDGPSAVQGEGILHTSEAALVAAWRHRDEQYAQRATPLTDKEVAAIRSQRVFESRFVEPRRRSPLYHKAFHWKPPKLGEWS